MQLHEINSSADHYGFGDVLGLDAWSFSCGLHPHTGLAMVSATLAAIAGDMFSFEMPATHAGSAGFNLAGCADDVFLATAMANLTAPLDSYQRALVSKARELSVQDLETTMYAPSHSDRRGDLLKQLGDPDRMRPDYSSTESRLVTDMSVSPQAVAYERLIRPAFMFKGTLPADLGAAISSCHTGHSLWIRCGLMQRSRAMGSGIGAAVRYAALADLLNRRPPDSNLPTGRPKPVRSHPQAGAGVHKDIHERWGCPRRGQNQRLRGFFSGTTPDAHREGSSGLKFRFLPATRPHARPSPARQTRAGGGRERLGPGRPAPPPSAGCSPARAVEAPRTARGRRKGYLSQPLLNSILPQHNNPNQATQ